MTQVELDLARHLLVDRAKVIAQVMVALGHRKVNGKPPLTIAAQRVRVPMNVPLEEKKKATKRR